MQRFYTPSQNITKGRIVISDIRHTHHIKDVLRYKIKDEIVVFDEKGNEYTGLIENITKNDMVVKIKNKRSTPEEKRIELTVACAIPKNRRMDEIVDKLTQLGVERIIPLSSKHSIVRLDEDKSILRLKRWQKIAQSASEQSQRNTLPILEPIKDIKELLRESNCFDLKLIPTLKNKRKSLRSIFADYKPRNVLVLIGPEGDFSHQEVKFAIDAGFIPISLGNLVLRVETAAVAVVSFIKLYADF